MLLRRNRWSNCPKKKAGETEKKKIRFRANDATIVYVRERDTHKPSMYKPTILVSIPKHSTVSRDKDSVDMIHK